MCRAEWAILGVDVPPWTCPAASRRLIFYWNIATGLNYCDGRLILRLNVQINFNEFFSCDIFSGARGMLKSLRNHNKKKWQPDCRWWPWAGGRCWEKKNRTFTVIKSIAIAFLPVKQVGMDVNTIIGDVMASRNSQSIKLSSSDDPTWVTDWMSGALRV